MNLPPQKKERKGRGKKREEEGEEGGGGGEGEKLQKFQPPFSSLLVMKEDDCNRKRE